MKTPLFIATQRIAAFELALMQASEELNHNRSSRRRNRSERRHGDRPQ